MAAQNHTSRTSDCNGRVILGQRFSRLLVVAKSELLDSRGCRPFWVCRCDCGAERCIREFDLRYGRTKSCGCLNRDRITTHGLSRSKTYAIWATMIQRCHNPNYHEHENYGGRGISVSSRWCAAFESFLEDMGEAPDGMEIDRIDNDGNYEPGNCRWATKKQNSRNKRTNHFLEHDGRRLTVVEWVEVTGLPESTIRGRLQLKWPDAKVLTQPVRKRVTKQRPATTEEV
jgi:hypothetical protein